MTNELIERLATHLYEQYDEDCLPSTYLDHAEWFLTDLGIDRLIAPEALQARLADLDNGEARTRQLLADAQSKMAFCCTTLEQIAGARQVLTALLEGKADGV
jgi:hypothetical protein